MGKSKRGYVMGLPKTTVQGRGDSLVYLFDADFSTMTNVAAPLPATLQGQVGSLKLGQVAGVSDFAISGGEFIQAHRTGWGAPYAVSGNILGAQQTYSRTGIALFLNNGPSSGSVGDLSGLGSGESYTVVGNAIGGSGVFGLDVYASSPANAFSGLNYPKVILLGKSRAYFFEKISGSYRLRWVSMYSSCPSNVNAYISGAIGKTWSRLSLLTLPSRAAEQVFASLPVTINGLGTLNTGDPVGNGIDVADSKDLDVWYSKATPVNGDTWDIPLSGTTTDVEVSFTNTTLPSSGTPEIALRRVDSTHEIVARIYSTGNYYIVKKDGGEGALFTGSIANGDTSTIVVRGNIYTIYKNGAVHGIVTNATFNNAVSGRIGLSTGSVISNLTIKTLNGIGQAAPLTQVTDYGGNGLHGVPTSVGLVGAPSEGGQYNGASYTNIYSATLASLFNGQRGSVVQREKCPASAWTDGLERRSVYISVDNSNRIFIKKHSTNNTMTMYRIAGAVTQTISIGSLSSTDFITYGITWDKSGDAFKAFINGAQSGSTQTGLADWAGSLASNACILGAANTVPQYLWSGAIADTLVTLDSVNGANDAYILSEAEHATIHGRMVAGTLTKAILDSIITTGKYLWYRHDDRKAVALPGLATDVLAGPRAVGDWFTHEANYHRLSYVVPSIPGGAAIRLSFGEQDAENRWEVWIGDTGTSTLYERVANSPASRASSGAGTVTAGMTITIVRNGTTITVYGGTTTLFSYSSASTFATKTMGRIIALGTGLASDLIARPYAFTAAAAPLTPGAAILEGAFTLMES